MRATIFPLLVFCGLSGPTLAQRPLEIGSPEAAFAGSSIHLSTTAANALRAHYEGDKVPLVAEPERERLDAALLGRDWPKVEALKKELAAKDGTDQALAWEQTRFVATGSPGLAEMHALDLAATGSPAFAETAAMLWFYAYAVTLTDGHKCVDEAAKEAHLDRLRGPAFAPVTKIVRTIGEDRMAAMRDLAVRLETALAPERTDDVMCREGNGKLQIKPEAAWRPEASLTRGMLAKHLLALGSVMRPHGVARAEPAQPAPSRPEPGKPMAAAPIPVARPVKPEPPAAIPTAKAVAAPQVEAPRPAPIDPAPIDIAVVNRAAGKPNPGRFEPPSLELTAPEPRANH